MGERDLSDWIRDLRTSDAAYEALRERTLAALARRGVKDRVAELVWLRVLAALLQSGPPPPFRELVERELARVRSELRA